MTQKKKLNGEKEAKAKEVKEEKEKEVKMEKNLQEMVKVTFSIHRLVENIN